MHQTIIPVASLRLAMLDYWLCQIMPVLQAAAENGAQGTLYTPPYISEAKILRRIIPEWVLTQLVSEGYQVESCAQQAYRITW